MNFDGAAPSLLGRFAERPGSASVGVDLDPAGLLAALMMAWARTSGGIVMAGADMVSRPFRDFLVIAVLAGYVCLGSMGAAADEQNPVIAAAATVVGAAEGAMAVMNHCRVVDPENADLYDGLVLRLLAIYSSSYNRIDKILRVEGVRSGRAELFYLAMLPSARDLAQTEVRDLAATLDPAQDVASCRAQRGEFQQQKGLFISPAIRFPAEMRFLDEWR